MGWFDDLFKSDAEKKNDRSVAQIDHASTAARKASGSGGGEDDSPSDLRRCASDALGRANRARSHPSMTLDDWLTVVAEWEGVWKGNVKDAALASIKREIIEPVTRRKQVRKSRAHDMRSESAHTPPTAHAQPARTQAEISKATAEHLDNEAGE